MQEIEQSSTENKKISNDRLQIIAEEGRKNEEIQTLMEYIKKGWPDKRNVKECVKIYYGFRDELSSENELVYKSNRIVIP